MGINQYDRDERAGTLPEEVEPDPVAILCRFAEMDGRGVIYLTGKQTAALLAHIGDIDLDAARYRTVRTHQDMGAVMGEPQCEPGSPAAIQFDRRVDALRLSGSPGDQRGK